MESKKIFFKVKEEKNKFKKELQIFRVIIQISNSKQREK